MLSPKLETERLILRRYNESDINAFYEILHDDRLHNYISFPDLTIEQELEYIRNCMKDVETDYDNVNIILRSLTDPKCVRVNISDNKIDYQIDLELGIELVGDVKVKIAVDDNLDEYHEITEETSVDKEIDETVNPNYLEKE